MYLGKSKDILLHPLCAFGPPPVALFDQLVYFLHCPISFSAQIKFPECFSLSIFIYICIVQIAKSICPNCKKTVSVQIAKCICPNCKMYLSKLSNVFVQISKYICLNCKIYLSKLPNVFVHISKCISLNCKMYLSKLRNVFFQISKCICPNCKLCLSKSQRFP